jgi:hypothetical protein
VWWEQKGWLSIKDFRCSCGVVSVQQQPGACWAGVGVKVWCCVSKGKWHACVNPSSQITTSVH